MKGYFIKADAGHGLALEGVLRFCGPRRKVHDACARASCVVFVCSIFTTFTIAIAPKRRSGLPGGLLHAAFTQTELEDVFVRPYFCLCRILRCYRLLTAIVAVCREKLARYHYLLIMPSTGISRNINKGLRINGKSI